MEILQPPSGGCVLKPALEDLETAWLSQPPSGGCVLKQLYRLIEQFVCLAAAFGRLCVETRISSPLNAFL